MTSATAELGKEGPRGRRMVREAVQDERRLTIGITTLQRVEGAVWQVEGDVFELHVCQASPRAVGREMLMLGLWFWTCASPQALGVLRGQPASRFSVTPARNLQNMIARGKEAGADLSEGPAGGSGE